MEQQRKDQCINIEYSISLGLTAEGKLMLSGQDGHWEDVDFCKNYAGYYSECRFTAIACGNGTFYAAGVDMAGRPHLFTSLMGSVWSETKLIDIQGQRQAEGKVVCILYDKTDDQIYLLCENGDLITVPDCMRCIRIRQVTDKQVIGGSMEGRDISVWCRDGSRVKIPMSAARQYRASAEYIAEQFGKARGYLVDFRHSQTGVAETALKESLPGALRESVLSGEGEYAGMDYAGFREWLGSIPQLTVLAFICESGVLAEEAALYARRLGWRRAYALHFG